MNESQAIAFGFIIIISFGVVIGFLFAIASYLNDIKKLLSEGRPKAATGGGQ